MSYPRKQICVVCGDRETEVIGPGDDEGRMCWLCLLDYKTDLRSQFLFDMRAESDVIEVVMTE